MADVKWIKIVTDIFDDEKIQIIESMPEGDAIALMWFKLLCVAGKTNQNGLLMLTDRIAYTEDMLAAIFRRDVKLVRLALQTFESMGMVEIRDNNLCVVNWNKHQNAKGLDDIREQGRIRQQEYRERQRLLTVSTETKNVDKEIQSKSKSKNALHNATCNVTSNVTRFIPPTVEEVAEYCRERGNSIDAQAFVDHYETNGWIRGKTKIKDWRACVRTWEKNSHERQDDSPLPRIITEV